MTKKNQFTGFFDLSLNFSVNYYVDNNHPSLMTKWIGRANYDFSCGGYCNSRTRPTYPPPQYMLLWASVKGTKSSPKTTTKYTPDKVNWQPGIDTFFQIRSAGVRPVAFGLICAPSNNDRVRARGCVRAATALCVRLSARLRVCRANSTNTKCRDVSFEYITTDTDQSPR